MKAELALGALMIKGVVIYYFITFILAILIVLFYKAIANRLAARGFDRGWIGLGGPAVFIVLAPITVPWWIVCFIRANKYM
jgi:hypothetical protein